MSSLLHEGIFPWNPQCDLVLYKQRYAENIIGSSRQVRTDQEGGGVSVAVSFLLTYITGLLLESISNIIAYTPAILLALYLHKRFIR